MVCTVSICLKLSCNSRESTAIFKFLKGYSSGHSHFSEINAKFAEENEFVTHFVQRCLETHENEQNVVLNESSEALGNRLDFGTCHDNS